MPNKTHISGLAHREKGERKVDIPCTLCVCVLLRVCFYTQTHDLFCCCDKHHFSFCEKRNFN